jgi:LVIVD repeat
MRESVVRPVRHRKAGRRIGAIVGAALLATLVMAVAASAQSPNPNDPRVGLAPGVDNAGVAKLGMDLTAHANNAPAFINPVFPGTLGTQIAFANSDMAFQGNHVFMGSFNGFQIWDVSNPAAPVQRTAFVCPGGQGDLSVYRNLLFMSVEETRAKKDCSANTPENPTTAENRFRGVRIFDISNITMPVQVGQVQTCRGSHTHTLVTDKRDRRNVYIYVSGTSSVRPPTELAGCDGLPTSGGGPPVGDNPSRWRIEVIKVPLAAPQNAAVVNEVRLFRDPETGAVNGLQNAPQTPTHPSPLNPTWQPIPITDACHDITVYPELRIAAGACEGNGLLIDIKDPANPKRMDAVADPLYAYWHGATFSNDGKTVVFTDEWGGGTNPRCRAADDLKWGGNSIYDIVKGKLVFRSYYKIPPVQTDQENCVSHIPSLVPVPGRDIFVQAWYQGGASLVDFSDSSNPVEIGYFDRGPIHPTTMVLGGLWSTYWYNGETYGSEIWRGLDVFGLTPTEDLSANEIAAAREVEVDRLNVQHQDRIRWKPSFAVVRALLDQLVRAGDIDAKTLAKVNFFLDKAEDFLDRGKEKSASNALKSAERALDEREHDDVEDAIDDLRDSLDDDDDDDD